MRLYGGLAALALLGLAVGLVLWAMRDNLVFFLTPTEAMEKGVEQGQQFRIGGLVEDGSYRQGADGVSHVFRITDMENEVEVRYRGLLPDLFREGQGVVAEGRFAADGSFAATTVLAKHDEKYMPPEVSEALKKSGHWQQEGAGYGNGPDSDEAGASEAPDNGDDDEGSR